MPRTTTAEHEFPPLSPREYIAFLCARFGKGYVSRKFGVCDRTVERWMSQEKWVGEESVRKGPVEKYEETLADCLEHGHVMEARAMVARHAKIVGCELRDREPVMSDKEDWRDELLDDIPAFARFQDAVRGLVLGEQSVDELGHRYNLLVRDLRETMQAAESARQR